MTAKTLNVTFGGLSCTIEGFDDPMPLLVSVIDYLRGLDPDLGGGTLVLDHLPEGMSASQDEGRLQVTLSAPRNAGAIEFGAPEHLAGAIPRQPSHSPPEQDERPSPGILSAAEVASFAAPEPAENPLSAKDSLGGDVLILKRPADPAPRMMTTTGRVVEAPHLAQPSGTAGPPPFSAPERRDPAVGTTPLILSQSLRVNPPHCLRPAFALAGENANLMPHEVDEVASPATRVAEVTLAEFMEQTVAISLEDRLEAATAHAIILEGRADVTRAMLLAATGQSAGNDEDFAEELRAFGALLRAGRLLKVDFARYRVAESSRFLTAARSLAQLPVDA